MTINKHNLFFRLTPEVKKIQQVGMKMEIKKLPEKKKRKDYKNLNFAKETVGYLTSS